VTAVAKRVMIMLGWKFVTVGHDVIQITTTTTTLTCHETYNFSTDRDFVAFEYSILSVNQYNQTLYTGNFFTTSKSNSYVYLPKRDSLGRCKKK